MKSNLTRQTLKSKVSLEFSIWQTISSLPSPPQERVCSILTKTQNDCSREKVEREVLPKKMDQLIWKSHTIKYGILSLWQVKPPLKEFINYALVSFSLKEFETFYQ